MPNSKQIVYLSQAQYAELIANGSITVNGVTVTYNENDLYVTPQAEPVTDVQIYGTSITNNGIANIPIRNWAGDSGLQFLNGYFDVNPASNSDIKGNWGSRRVLTPDKQDRSTFYGLAKAAGDSTQSASSNAVGTYTDDAKQKIQNMLGITDLLSTEETTTATAAHALNSTFMMNGKLHRATAAIAIGDAVEVGTNCEVVKVDEVFPHDVQVNGNTVINNGIANITAESIGASGTYGIGTITVSDIKHLKLNSASEYAIKIGNNNYQAITPTIQHQAVFYGLSKVAGVDLANETVTLGTYPETSKTAIRSLIGAAAASDIPSVPVQDVQVNGTSVLSSGVANVPIASSADYGVVKVQPYNGLEQNFAGYLQTAEATSSEIKNGLAHFKPIVPVTQDKSVFYGLAKVAGADEKDSTLSVGTYTETAKTAIRNMLGAASPDVIAIQDTQPTNTDTKVWLPETQAAGVQVPTMEDLGDYVQKTDYATTSNYGVIKVGAGLTKDGNNALVTDYASDDVIKSGSGNRRPITPSYQYKSVFYGLAKAAGDTTQSQSSNAVGTYTADASAAIRTMLGAIGSEDYATENAYGLVKVNSSYGIAQNSGSGSLQIVGATVAQCKSRVGSTGYQPLTVYTEDASTFYGLAYAAGDTTMTSSSNAVGTYTDSAKASIKSMLGIVDGSTGTVDITGTTPSITAVENTRYVCGEVSTLSFTPAASGICIVRFTSGSTATVLTVPNTVKFPEWFDITALEADTIYEMCITDGVYGAVMSWAL